MKNAVSSCGYTFLFNLVSALFPVPFRFVRDGRLMMGE
jgi:hypothetical protein